MQRRSRPSSRASFAEHRAALRILPAKAALPDQKPGMKTEVLLLVNLYETLPFNDATGGSLVGHADRGRVRYPTSKRPSFVMAVQTMR